MGAVARLAHGDRCPQLDREKYRQSLKFCWWLDSRISVVFSNLNECDCRMQSLPHAVTKPGTEHLPTDVAG